MIPFFKKTLCLTLIVSLLLVLSCTSNSPIEVPKPKTVQELIDQAGELQQTTLTGVVEDNLGTVNEPPLNENGIQYASKSQKKKISNRVSSIIAFNSAYADALYPGSLVQGKDIPSAILNPIITKVQPITITLQGGGSLQVQNPSYAEVTSKRIELIRSAKPQPAQIEYTKTEMYSTEQALTKLGINANWLVGSISSSLNTERSTKKHSIFMYFRQVYYTLSSSLPTIDTSVTVDELSRYVQTNNPPCYISSVDYGRIILARLTSEASYDAMLTDLQGSYAIAKGSAMFNKQKLKEKYEVAVTIIGGSAQGAAKAVTGDIEELNHLISSEAVVSESVPGFPINYTVRYLKNSKEVGLSAFAEYTIPNWVIDPSRYTKSEIYFHRFDIIDDDETFGSGEYTYNIELLDSNNQVLESISESNEKSVGSGEQLPINRSFQNVYLDKININGNSRIRIELFDTESGTIVSAGVVESNPLPALTQRGDYSWNVSNNNYKAKIVWSLIPR